MSLDRATRTNRVNLAPHQCLSSRQGHLRVDFASTTLRLHIYRLSPITPIPHNRLRSLVAHARSPEIKNIPRHMRLWRRPFRSIRPENIRQRRSQHPRLGRAVQHNDNLVAAAQRPAEHLDLSARYHVSPDPHALDPSGTWDTASTAVFWRIERVGASICFITFVISSGDFSAAQRLKCAIASSSVRPPFPTSVHTSEENLENDNKRKVV